MTTYVKSITMKDKIQLFFVRHLYGRNIASPSSNLHIFEENTHLESPGISKFPPINNLHEPLASTPPQAIHSLDTPLYRNLKTHQNVLNVTTRLQEHIIVQDANGTCMFIVGNPTGKKDSELVYGVLSVTCIGYRKKVKWNVLG